jgi:hypothetical protein
MLAAKSGDFSSGGDDMPCYFQIFGGGRGYALLNGGSKSPQYIDWLELAGWTSDIQSKLTNQDGQNLDPMVYPKNPSTKPYGLTLTVDDLPASMVKYLNQPLPSDAWAGKYVAKLECTNKEGSRNLLIEFYNPSISGFDISTPPKSGATLQFTFTQASVTYRMMRAPGGGLF